jgi:hypothetical protein
MAAGLASPSPEASNHHAAAANARLKARIGFCLLKLSILTVSLKQGI